MLIESFAPNPDAVEIHKIEIVASPEIVYRALWTTDLADSPVIKGLMTLRSLPTIILHPGQRRRTSQKITLHTLLEAGFGKLAEEGREIVLGITGRFWRPISNTLPFQQKNFQGPVPPGLARAVWNFTVQEISPQRTLFVHGDSHRLWRCREQVEISGLLGSDTTLQRLDSSHDAQDSPTSV